MSPLRAAAAYAALAFAAGFVLGVVRTLVVAPRIGPVAAVALETPIILAISWAACDWTMRRFDVPTRMPVRLAVGAAALAVLIALEVALAFAFGRSARDIAAGFASDAGRLALAAQLGFALFPAVQARLTSRGPHR